MRKKGIRFGEIELAISDPNNVAPVMADVIVEARLFNDVIALSLATVVTDGASDPEAVVCARLRLTLANAIDLRSTLDNLLSASKPKGPAN